MLTDHDTMVRVAEALAALPISQYRRRLIFEAIDKAPLAQPWFMVKEIDLAAGQLVKPLTMEGAVRWETCPSASQILAGLNYAIGMLPTGKEKEAQS